MKERETKKLITKLNELLANYQVFYMNARGFHWNIAGEKFFELHAKFEEIYTDSLVKIDEIAERVLMLGGVPQHTFADYLQHATISQVKDVSKANEAVKQVVDGFKTLLEQEKEILELSASYSDEGTNALMSDYIRQQEKLVWMYSAFLKK